MRHLMLSVVLLGVAGLTAPTSAEGLADKIAKSAEGSDVQAVDRSDETPDFCQTDPAGHFPGDGSEFCAPTAVSNSLLYLADHGYPRLRPHGDEKSAQVALIRQLASAEYMNTNPRTGTGNIELMSGLEKFIHDAGYRATLRLAGWRETTRHFPVESETPSPRWFEQQLADSRSTAVFLNVGWYRYDEDSETYTRKGGHWVTLVGFGRDRDGQANSHLIEIHDPSPKAGVNKRTQFIKLEPLEGTLERSAAHDETKQIDATGFYEMKGEMGTSTGYDAAIIDVAVAVALQ